MPYKYLLLFTADKGQLRWKHLTWDDSHPDQPDECKMQNINLDKEQCRQTGSAPVCYVTPISDLMWNLVSSGFLTLMYTS